MVDVENVPGIRVEATGIAIAAYFLVPLSQTLWILHSRLCKDLLDVFPTVFTAAVFSTRMALGLTKREMLATLKFNYPMGRGMVRLSRGHLTSPPMHIA